MKKIFNTIYLLMLATIFSTGGFYLGSKGQKVEIILPAFAKPIAEETANATELVAKATSTKPVTGKAVKPAAKPKTVVSTPAPAPVTTPTPAPAPAPEPQTFVS